MSQSLRSVDLRRFRV